MSPRRRVAATTGKGPPPLKRTKTEGPAFFVSTDKQSVPGDDENPFSEQPTQATAVSGTAEDVESITDQGANDVGSPKGDDDEESVISTLPNTPQRSPKKAVKQTVLPSPTGVVTTLHREYFTKPLVTRLNRMNTHEDEKNHCFALSRLPTGLRWGSGMGGANDNIDYVCHDGEPLQVWLVGEIESCHFREWDSDAGSFQGAARKPSITIRPLLSTDEERAKDMIMHLSSPIQAKEALQEAGIIISRFMAPADTKPEDVDKFESVYDATRPRTGNASLSVIDAAALKEHDVVLVAAFLHHYYIYDNAEIGRLTELVTEEHQQRGATFRHRIRFVENKHVGYRRRYWRATWELDSIYQVLSAPLSAKFKKAVNNGASMPL